MKYCIDFYGKNIDLLHEVDEINVDLSHIKDLKGELLEFCELYKEQRINLCIKSYEDAINNDYFIFCLDFQKKYNQYNIVIRLPWYDENWCPKIKEDYPEAKVYFNTKIVDWDTLIFYMDYGVTDLIIVEALGFELKHIAELAHEKEIQIRVFPNVAQAARKETPGFLKFWIRPEDVDVYEKYVDVFELFYDKYEKQKIYYTIYKNDKKWFGDLREIIIGLDEELNSTRIVPRFAEKRTRCGRECMKGGKCRLCHRIIDLSKTLEKTPIGIWYQKGSEDIINGERTVSESGNSEENFE